ncbi:MAG: ATP synthase F1 subunit epsilon [Bdellovibrionales bacterium]|nr:ATP synthase F1 subunit epsilon [Bdellovibrionales bacterium]
MSASTLNLRLVTPERSIVSGQDVEAIVLPGDRGQLTALPGHINFITPLRLGSFAYKIRGEWSWAYVTGGFAQIFNGHATVLADTLEMAHELVLAEAELELQGVMQKLKNTKVGTPEYSALIPQKELAEAKIAAAKKHAAAGKS